MEVLKNIGLAGFFFFLIKGLVWLVIFYLIYKGVLDKEKVANYKKRIYSKLFPFRTK